ncbi:MAG: metal-dependent transcriptional regulator [Actinomyces sp.]|nr:metal-dependent transcriptional regulator [Actinomyces sp.]MDN6566529.1 metal-dependent transcriptional regulator [Actinomyces sp.]
MGDLIDTTEMYLKTIYELGEDDVTPLRARIVERLGHSGPTVSQTVARMERDGLLHVLGDRRLELTQEGQARAVEVMRKHRLAERLLLDVIGMDWVDVHEEACRWEHVMSDQVEGRLVELLHDPSQDPFGNPVPGGGSELGGTSAELLVRRHGDAEVQARIRRIGEPIQADRDLLGEFSRLGLAPGSPVHLREAAGVILVTDMSGDEGDAGSRTIALPATLAPHLFLDVTG